jgi:hypothetical protein
MLSSNGAAKAWWPGASQPAASSSAAAQRISGNDKRRFMKKGCGMTPDSYCEFCLTCTGVAATAPASPGLPQGRFQAVFLSRKGLQPSLYLRWQLSNA